MFDMFMNSVTLFARGRLFKNLGDVMQKVLIGMVIGAAILVGLVKAGLAIWMAVIISSLVCGAIQPFLFKDLKYA